MLRYLNAGESHGKCLLAILEGMPAGLQINADYVNSELVRRQKGYGRGKRMEIESDTVSILSGVRLGKTIGSPIGLLIANRDWENNKELVPLTKPRPGHADLAGALKYGFNDLRSVLERASARETASRVAAGAVCKKFLSEFGIKIFSAVEQIGKVQSGINVNEIEKIYPRIENSQLRCPVVSAEKKLMELIDKAGKNGDTLGGKFVVVAKGVPVGLGSYVQWDRKIDARMAMAVMSIQAVKGVEFGCGFNFAASFGSEVHDGIRYDNKDKRFYHSSNNAGGIAGGMTNGEDIVLHAVMKPIPTLGKPLDSIDIKTKKVSKAEIVRSDVCAVPACAVIAESAVSFELAGAILEKFGGDSIPETKRNFENYLKDIKKF